MEPFRIICETCQSRLKIRSPDVIGEIHACPKCGSMVHIQPPAGWSAEVVPPPHGQLSTPAAAFTLTATESAIIPASVAFALPAELGTPQTVAAEAPVSPPAAAASQWIVWAFGGAALVLVGGVALAVLSGQGDKADREAPTAAATDASHVVKQPKSAPVAPETNKPKPPADDPYAVDHSKDSVPAAKNLAKETSPAKPPVDTKAASEPPVTAPKPAAVAESKPPSVPAPAAKPAEVVVKAGDHSPVLKFDPLDFDPDRLGASARSFAEPATSTTSVPNEPPAAHAAGAEAAAAGGGPPPGAVAAAGNALPPPVVQPAVTARRGQLADAAPKAAAQQLAVRVKAFQANDISLVRLVETLSGIAGAGVTLDPIALALVGVSPRTTVTVNVQDSSVDAILRGAIESHHLEIAEQGGQVRVGLPKPDERRTLDCDVKDLVKGTDAASVAQLIQHFVAPATWQGSGGTGTIQIDGTTLHIEQTDSVRRQVVIFCERLRLARGLPFRSKYAAALLAAESPYQKLAAKLNEHTTFTFLAWTRLADVLRQLEEMSSLTILVDWAALADTELSPSSPIACSANDRTWQESLDGILEPLGLGWWAVDGQTIQITSISALEKIERVEFYQMPPKLRAQFATGQALVDALQKNIADAAGKQGKAAQLRLEFDEPSGRLIVLATQGAHRNLSQQLTSTAK